MKRKKFEKTLQEFIDLWSELGQYDIDLAFEDGVVHSLGDPVEICWNHDNTTECYNP
jgi:hypothetical protein